MKYTPSNIIRTKKQVGEWKWGVDEKTELNESQSKRIGGYGLDLPVLGQGTVRAVVKRVTNFRVVRNARNLLTGQVRVTFKKNMFHILISYVVVKLKC